MLKSKTLHIEDRRQFISEAFHSFHQPLTSLHCGLELCLLKPRTEQEYRRRVADALTHAGAVLELNKALRELVESSDPGEDLGNVAIRPILEKLAEDLSYLADAALVTVRMECDTTVSVSADPGKLVRHLGNAATTLIGALEPGSTIRLRATPDTKMVSIALTAEGKRRTVPDGTMQAKLESIRLDAASSYAWTLGGEFRKTKAGFTLTLPISK